MNVKIVGGSIAAFAIASVIAGLAYSSDESSSEIAAITIYKDPDCGCCGDWAEHLEESGLSVKVVLSDDMDSIKVKYGVPYELESCHTADVGGYFVEGHVPAEHVKWLLSEAPDIKGIAVPGMPGGSPGMNYGEAEPYNVVILNNDGSSQILASY